jgi:hypothetical protein
MTQVLAVPDYPVGDDNGQIILVDDRSSSELGFHSQVSIMTKDEMASLASDEQQRIFEFLPPEHFPEKISVRLRLSIAWPGYGFLPVGEIVATFYDRDPLIAVEPTHVMAY